MKEEETKETDFLNDLLKEKQKVIDSIECWLAISQSNTILSPGRIDKFKKLDVYDDIEKDLKEYAKNKAKELAEETGRKVEGDISLDEIFTKEEVLILKQLAQKVLNQKSLKEESPIVVQSQPTPNVQDISKKKKKPIDESKDDKNHPGVGDVVRISGTDTLRFIVGRINDVPTYSSVKIEELSSDKKSAKIRFLMRGSDTVTATININELLGYEHLD